MRARRSCWTASRGWRTGRISSGQRQPPKGHPDGTGEGLTHEHLDTLHQTADRHLAGHGGAGAGRHRRLSAAAGRAAAARRFSHHRGDGAASGRKSGNHGGDSGAAAGDPDRADSRRLAAYLHQRAGRHQRDGAVRPRPQHRRRGRRHPGGDQFRQRAVAEDHAGAADLPEGQSLRRADHDPGGPVGRHAADRDRRLCRERAVAADLAACRRGAGADRRPAEAVRAGAGRSGQTRRDGPDDGGRAQHAGPRHDRCAQGQHRRRDQGVYRARQ